MKFTQRRFLTSTEFEFLQQRLNYTFRDASGSKQLSVDYADVSFDTRRITERHSSYLYAGSFLLGLGIILGAYMYATEYSVGVFIYVVIGLILLVVYKFHRKDYVLLTAGKDILMVLGDEKSHTIVEEIEKIQESAILRNVETARSPRRRIETQGVHCMVSRTTSGYKSRGGEPA